MTRITRRKLIIGSTVAVGVAGLTGAAIVGPRISTWMTDSSVTSTEHEADLNVPPLYEGEMLDGVRQFALTMQEGISEFVSGQSTSTWGVNADFLGPTLRASRGETVRIEVKNDLPNESVLHWHGMHLPAEMDGGPHQIIAPGESWVPIWDVDQPAATLWYHPHPHGATADHVWKGLAGLFIIDDDVEASLPSEYGVDDIPLVIQDRGFEDDGDFDNTEWSFGYFGDHILVNGTWGAKFDVTRRLTRFRILNGSNTRWYNLAFEDDRPFRLIATDAGYVGEDPPEITSLLISPGERAEIVVAFDPGDDVMLMSKGEDRWQLDDYGVENDFDVIRFVAGDDIDDSNEIAVPAFESMLGQPVSENRRRYALEGHNSINGKEMDMSRIDEVITAGAEEIWEVSATRFASHNFHIHGVSFEVLDVDGEEPPVHQLGPKDTAQILKNKTVTLRVTFPEYTDETYPYMYHCHILRHEDNGMMGQFLVVEPGRENEAPRRIEGFHDHH